jgi:hypothetical protein
MSEFNPSRRVMAHDRLNDYTFTWKPQKFDWGYATPNSRGVIEWDGLLLDGWYEAKRGGTGSAQRKVETQPPLRTGRLAKAYVRPPPISRTSVLPFPSRIRATSAFMRSLGSPFEAPRMAKKAKRK